MGKGCSSVRGAGGQEVAPWDPQDGHEGPGPLELGFIEPFNFSFFRVTGWGIDLDYCDIEWFALEPKRDHCVIFEIAPSTA